MLLTSSVASLQEQVRVLEVTLKREREEGAEHQSVVAASAKARIDKVKDLVFMYACILYIHIYRSSMQPRV